MGEHHRGKDAGAIFRESESADGRHFRKRLEAVLGHEPGKVFFVFAKGNAAMPDTPIVEVAGLERWGGLFVVGARRTGPVRRFGEKTIPGAIKNPAENG